VTKGRCEQTNGRDIGVLSHWTGRVLFSPQLTAARWHWRTCTRVYIRSGLYIYLRYMSITGAYKFFDRNNFLWGSIRAIYNEKFMFWIQDIKIKYINYYLFMKFVIKQLKHAKNNIVWKHTYISTEKINFTFNRC